MKIVNKLPKKEQEDIAGRLKELRQEHNLSQNTVSNKIGVSIKTYREWETGIKGIDKDGKHIYYYPSIDYNNLMALADLYHVSVDYLLCRSNFKSPENDFVGKYTGLSDSSINTIRGIKQESENWKANWRRYKEIYSSKNIKFDNPGYDDLTALNFMLECEGTLSLILRGLQDLCHTNYTIPVHLENGEFVIPDNNYEHQPEVEVPGGKFPEYYYLLLARSKSTPNDNIPLALDESFFKSLALKKIESTFLTIAEVYKENKK